ncbi:MAG TPA: hypothetical protein VMT19_10165, partial [Thermoanaerobaculaceae bacterium]|nr:hypothetical protein [Thermoanaerobaculaceae bacterium]
MSVHNRREPAWHRQVISALGKWKARNSLALSATLMRNLNRRMTPVHLQRLTASALGYTERLRVPGVPYGRYLYRERGVPVLYASVFAALLRHLAGDLESLTEQERSEWVSYVNSFQSADGLYRDPAVQSAQAE